MKRTDESGELFRLLDAGDMARAGDDLEPRAGDRAGQRFHQFRRRRAILIADDAKRRHSDRGGVGGEIRIADRCAGGRITGRILARQHGPVAGQFFARDSYGNPA